MRPVYYLLAFLPVAIALEEVFHASAALVFAASALSVIPSAAMMGTATEHLAARSGPGIGGLLNVTFGNAPEIIIAIFALAAGLQEVVKASLVGSIIGNILLVMGASMVVGGWRRERQTFNQTAMQAQSAMLLLALAALIVPAVYQLVHGGGLPRVGERGLDFGPALNELSLAVSLVLLLSYAAGLLFSLRTHRQLFNPYQEEEPGEHEEQPPSVRRSLGLLALAGVLVGVSSELLVGSITEASHSIGISEFFVGVIVVAVVGNAAEHWVAVLVARKDQMDLSINIALGSSAQIALFAAPVLVLLSFVISPFPMALVFNGYEIGAMLFAVVIGQVVVSEGESNWFEGVQLLALYVILGLLFYYA
ncbi:MAG: calcium/proton exchanger [Actinomycetota bacterium]|nr:calcium/proton exchanger [Actinomycetota bacterium]